MASKNQTTSIKVREEHKDFFKKFRLNIIRGGGSEKALDLSYDDLLEKIVQFFKSNSDLYTQMVRGVAKDV